MTPLTTLRALLPEGALSKTDRCLAAYDKRRREATPATFAATEIEVAADAAITELATIAAKQCKRAEAAESALAGSLPDDTEPEVVAAWTDFWRDIVCPDGRLDIAQVARELHDWHVAMHEVSLVYDELTMGHFSKPNTAAPYVINRVNELEAKRVESALAKAKAANKLLRDAVEAEVAWHDAEDEHPKTTTFEERLDLCHYSEWAARRAIGRDVPDEYVPLPKLVLRLRETAKDAARKEATP